MLSITKIPGKWQVISPKLNPEFIVRTTYFRNIQNIKHDLNHTDIVDFLLMLKGFYLLKNLHPVPHPVDIKRLETSITEMREAASSDFDKQLLEAIDLCNSDTPTCSQIKEELSS